MVDWSANLKLPYIAPSQAQKHVTHNEALALLDAVVQLVPEGFGEITPPALPSEGAVYALGSGATGAWAGQDAKLAVFRNGGWVFVEPQIGWQAAAGAALRVWNGSGWVQPELQNLEGVGIGTSFTAGNPLSVAGAATLLTHIGAGHQLKINKAAPANTASLLFQTSWAGRAEMGTTGSDDFSIKVSADGTLWSVAQTTLGASGRTRFGAGIEATSGTAAAPGYSFDGDSDTGIYRVGADSLGIATNGAQRVLVTSSGVAVTGSISGTAVQSTSSDTTTGRLMPVGAFGLGGAALSLSATDNLDNITASGFYYNPTGGNCTGNNYPIVSAGSLVVVYQNSIRCVQYFTLYGVSAGTYVRSLQSGGWSAWSMLYGQRSILGAVSQTAGAPTGALIERGSNANGSFAKFADGTMICSNTITNTALAISTSFLGGFRSAAQTWTFPAAFAVAPVLSGHATMLSAFGVAAQTAPTTTAAGYIFTAVTSSVVADRTLQVMAFGRWF